MADEKKDVKKDAAGTGLFHKDHYKEVLYGLLPFLFLIAYLLNRLFVYLDSIEYSALTSVWDRIVHALIHLWHSWKPAAVVLSGMALAAIVYCRRQLAQIGKEEEKIYGREPEDAFLETGTKAPRQNERWERILKHAHSDNPAEWRVAIIEADIMLDELLSTLNYPGDGIGEKLKAVEPSDMLTLDKAWEAHKVRNRIAHSGQDFNLTDRETRRVVSLFEEVFKEYQII